MGEHNLFKIMKKHHDKNNLLPCPLCGGEASLSIEEVGMYDCPAVCCEQCNLSIYDEESFENVIKKWNTRTK